MIRRKFMKYAPKEHSDEKVKKTLEKHNVPVYEGAPPAKFGQFGNIAKDIAAKSRKTFTTPEGGNVAEADKTFGHQQKALYGGGNSGPVTNDPRNPYTVTQPQGNPYARASPAGNPYAGGGGGGGGAQNPYAKAGPSSQAAGNPYGSRASPAAASYGGSQQDPYASDPYASDSYASDPYASDPYASPAPDPYGVGPADPYGSGETTNPYGSGETSNPYGSGETSNPYGSSEPSMYGSRPSGSRSTRGMPADDTRSIRSNAGGGYGAPLGAPLGRTQTNTSRAPSIAPSRAPSIAPSQRDFDELNQADIDVGSTDVGGGDEDDELMHSNASIYGGRGPSRGTPSIRSGVDNFGGAAGGAGVGGMGEIPEDEEDELNQMPSEYARTDGYQTGQQLFEDSEDEDVENVKTEMRQVKNESLASTRRALQIAHEAETSGRNTLGMLGDQGERLGNSAKTVSIGHVQARVADANADELARLNRSIFIPNVSNPFNSRRRHQMKEQRLKSQREFDEREALALDKMQRDSERRVTDGLNGGDAGYSETALRIQQRMNRDNPERKMYQFEADSEDDEIEDELAQNLEGISQASKRLHGLSLKINDEVDAQNGRIEQMGGRVEDLDYNLHRSTAKMATIN